MKILHISNSKDWSGAEIMLLELLKNDRINEHIVVAPEGEFLDDLLKKYRINFIICNYLKRVNRKSAGFFLLKYLKYLFFVLINNLIVLRILLTAKPDVVQVVHFSSFLSVIASRFFYKAPILVWQHDIINNNFFIDKILLVFFSKFVKKFICVSGAVLNNLHSLGVKKRKLELIYNGIDLNIFRREYAYDKILKEEYSIDQNTAIIALVAAFVPWKGHEILVRAANILNTILRPEKNDWIVLFIGGDLQSECHREYREFLIQLVQANNLENKVIFVGKRSDMNIIYNDIDILVNASTSPEPFGLTVGEGMAMELAVIGSELGGIPEIIQDNKNGWLVAPGDSHVLAEKINYILNNKEEDGLGAIKSLARTRIEDYFSSERFVNNFQNLYKTL